MSPVRVLHRASVDASSRVTLACEEPEDCSDKDDDAKDYGDDQSCERQDRGKEGWAHYENDSDKKEQDVFRNIRFFTSPAELGTGITSLHLEAHVVPG